MNSKELEEFIDLYKVPKFNDNGYILGIFQPGITVYNQQLRSLNILYALHKLGKLEKSSGIAVIGAGIAGLTFAAGALELGYNVDLFEKSPLLIPYQYGCDTRRIHPHFYNWPEPLSEYPYSELPFFRWKEETASIISKDIYKSFKTIAEKHSAQYKEHRNARISKEDITFGEKNIKIEFDDDNALYQKTYSTIVLAIGYGVEKRVEWSYDFTKNKLVNLTDSYWRNDQYEQVDLAKDKFSTYIVSGVGDGALSDLLRLKILGYSTSSIINNLKNDPNPSNYQSLKQELLKILDEYSKKSNKAQLKENQFLYRAFEKLYKGKLLDYLIKEIDGRIRTDNFVILHHRRLSLKEIFNLTQASLFNNLMAYILLKKRYCGFKRVNLELNYEEWNGTPYLMRQKEQENLIRDREDNLNNLIDLINSIRTRYPNDISEEHIKLILRHGTNKKHSLLELGLEEGDIENLRKKQLNSLDKNHLFPLWKPNWWHDELDDYERNIEFVEPELAVIANTFVSSIASILRLSFSNLKEKGYQETIDFRVTLHRIVNKNGIHYYQQVSNYFGSENKKRQSGAIGRLFPIEIGIVGYSCKTGRSLILQKVKPPKEYLSTWDALMATESEREEKKIEKGFDDNDYTTDNLNTIKSLFTCPIFFRKERKIFPLFCLYVDSSYENFSPEDDDLDILKLIYSMTSGFVSNLQLSIKQDGLIKTENLVDSLLEIDSAFKDKTLNKPIEESKSLKEPELFTTYKNRLMIEDVTPHYLTLNYRY